MTRLLTPIIVLCLAAPAAAQPAGTTEPLPLDQALQQALDRNASLHAAASASDAAGAAIDAARSAWYPRINVSEAWQRGTQPTFVFSSLLASRRFAASNFAVDQLNHPGALGYFHSSVGIEQLLFDGGARRASVTSARAQQRMATLSEADARLSVAAGVTELYGQLLAAQAQRRATQAALDAGREDLARATRRRDAGVATEADVLALAVHVSDVEQRTIQADGAIVSLRAQLNRMTGAPFDRLVEAVEPSPVAPSALPDTATLIADAQHARPDLQRAEAAVEVAEQGERAARAAFIPQAAAQAALDVSGTRVADRASSWVAGAEVRWSFALGGAERAGLKMAAAHRARARAEAEDARAKVAVDVITAVQQLATAQARQTVGRATVAQARESQRIIRDRYDAGLAPVNDVLAAATAVLDAEAHRVSAVVDALTAGARLAQATGRLP